MVQRLAIAKKFKEAKPEAELNKLRHVKAHVIDCEAVRLHMQHSAQKLANHVPWFGHKHRAHKRMHRALQMWTRRMHNMPCAQPQPNNACTQFPLDDQSCSGLVSSRKRAPRSLTQKAAGDLVHVAPSFKGVQAQNDDVELLIEVSVLLLYAAEVRGHSHALHSLHHSLGCHLCLGLAHVPHPAGKVASSGTGS